MKLKLYYIVEETFDTGLKYISGPFGSYGEAFEKTLFREGTHIVDSVIEVKYLAKETTLLRQRDLLG